MVQVGSCDQGFQCINEWTTCIQFLFTIITLTIALKVCLCIFGVSTTYTLPQLICTDSQYLSLRRAFDSLLRHNGTEVWCMQESYRYLASSLPWIWEHAEKNCTPIEQPVSYTLNENAHCCSGHFTRMLNAVCTFQAEI